MDLTNFIIEQALILIPVLYVLGLFLKVSQLPNRFIPLSLLVVGLVLSVFLIGFNINAIIQGVLVSGAAVFTDQILKQFKKEQ